jgi:ABC-2 type transport system ATP-binding protein
LSHAVEAFELKKSFTRKRSVKELLTHPFRKAEQIHALRGVDLHVRSGEIFGLLGPNGAGKTTLLKIFSCLVLPDSGRAVLGGEDTVHEARVKPQLGLVHSDERSFYWRLSGRENLRFFARLYDVPGREIGSRIDYLLEQVDMVDAADRRFADYSSGMKQRLAISRALLHDPPILLMDEPTRSLDPASSLALREFIRERLHERDGKTIILATHNLREAEALCSRLAILVKGRVRQVGTVAEVRRWGIEERRYRFEVAAWPPRIDARCTVVADEPFEDGRRVTISLDADSSLDGALRALIAAGVVIRSCERLEPDLEDAFSRILKSEPAEDDA